MNGWESDKAWSDKYVPRIKEILGTHLIGPAPKEDDQERNTDLIVLKMDPVRIGCRIRRPEYADRYIDEFTIRSGRPSGIKTELTKIIEGWGDYFFYGFAADDVGELKAWGLGKLSVFRLWFNRTICLNGGRVPGSPQLNRDGSSGFLAFSWCDLPDEFVVASEGLSLPVNA